MLRKTASLVSAIAILSTGLVACNVGDNAMDTRYNDNAQPIGYYNGDRNGDMIDNDGPITEMFDGGVDENENFNNVTGVNNRNGLTNNNGRLTPLTMDERNRARNYTYSRNDYNYHDHVGNNLGADEELAERIADQVAKLRNIEDVNTFVTANNVVVAVDTNDRNNRDVVNQVRSVVERMARGRNVNVVTDEANFRRVGDINRDLNNGRNVDNDIQDFFNDIGETITEPFDVNNR